jgi:hypothetical protein
VPCKTAEFQSETTWYSCYFRPSVCIISCTSISTELKHGSCFIKCMGFEFTCSTEEDLNIFRQCNATRYYLESRVQCDQLNDSSVSCFARMGDFHWNSLQYLNSSIKLSRLIPPFSHFAKLVLLIEKNI